MKPQIFVILLILLPFYGLSQKISHSLVELERTYDPLFSKSSSIIRLDFVQTYTLGMQDTSYSLSVAVSEKTVEIENLSLGTAYFSSTYSSGSGIGVGADYSIDKKQGVEELNYEEFMKIYDCIGSVYTFITTMEIKKDNPYSTIATCTSKKLTIGVEFVPRREYQAKPSYNFYFQVGDATFSLKRDQFEELAKTIRTIKHSWNYRMAEKS